MRMNSVVRCAALTVGLAAAVPAAASSPVADVGSVAPPLELAAADASSRSLAAIDGPRVLIFYRGLW